MERKSVIALLAAFVASMVSGCAGGEKGSDIDIPDTLPFVFTREDSSQPPTEQETAAFTRKITGFWKDIDYFGWALWHAHGLHASYSPDMPEYGLWWQDTKAVKSGDLVTFVHYGGADNLEIRTSKVLAQAISLYLSSGDDVAGRLGELYCKGIVALFQGMLWGPDDPNIYVTARAIFTHNHEYTDRFGHRVAVDYDPVKKEKYDWNAHTVPNPSNPVFGSIWVRNMRSKDDLPHLFRVAPLMLRAARDAKDPAIRDAALVAWQYMQGFARDIVDHGYMIRTKEDGRCYVPTEEENPDAYKDLATFVNFENLIPNAECNPKLTSALLGYGDPMGNDCGNGISTQYEDVATQVHYFNYAIVRYFHLTAILHAILNGQNTIALKLLEGLVERVEAMESDDAERAEHMEWDADAASFLLAAGAAGLPLTGDEARLIQQRYSMAVDHYRQYKYWDLYDSSVPDGEYDYKPSRDAADTKHVRPEEMAYLIEYCYSPFRNPAGVDPVDCDVVLSPARWGE
ncbi:MAG: hypothetical protein D6806_09780 [Deltaproteobacteria bacterium]|nr:MAG: hypothetical protein D6806_09780 [Deltaproteobacteria bacterium]